MISENKAASDRSIRTQRPAAAMRIEAIVQGSVSRDVRPLETLPRLRRISLACPVRAAIDFSKFFQLQDIFLCWRKAYGSVFGLGTFNRINLLDYPERDLTVWNENNRLRELQLQSK